MTLQWMQAMAASTAKFYAKPKKQKKKKGLFHRR